MKTKILPTILLVDDDEVDRAAFVRALQKQNAKNKIVTAKDGIEALQVLREQDSSELITQPVLILLDLNMPRMNGIEFLEEMRCDNRLHHNIVLILTTSNAMEDKIAAYQKHVAGYLVKSEISAEYPKVIDMIDQYMEYVQFPPNELN